MNDSKNPLSPHLQIYRWQVSSLVSIIHRITGILNLLGLIFICALDFFRRNWGKFF